MCVLEVAMCEKCRSSHFQSEGEIKSLRTGGLKNFRAGRVTNLGGYFCWGGVSTPLHAMFEKQTGQNLADNLLIYSVNSQM